jgi:hypothetical protein
MKVNLEKGFNMKYIITENRLNNLIFKFLDVKLDGIEEKKGKFYDIVFAFPGNEHGIMGWEKSEVLYVFNKLRDEISNYFGLEKDDSLRVIGKWVEDRYNLKVMNTSNNIKLLLLMVGDRN